MNFEVLLETTENEFCFFIKFQWVYLFCVFFFGSKSKNPQLQKLNSALAPEVFIKGQRFSNHSSFRHPFGMIDKIENFALQFLCPDCEFGYGINSLKSCVLPANNFGGNN